MVSKNETKNKLYFGDNLDILRDKITDNSVDLIYLDPPFQSGKNYNQIFQPEQGEAKGATAQIKAFEDTWYWGVEAEKSYEGLITGSITKEKPNQKLIDLMKSMRSYLGEVPLMAYLSMMSPRLLEMKRVLKNTGSIYLHCDPTASHYLKLLMDAVFGTANFRNEIVWHYPSMSRTNKDFPRKHDTIFRYSMSDVWTFNWEQILIPYAESTISRAVYGGAGFEGKEGKKQYLTKSGKIPDTVWDIPHIKSKNESVGYPTQKPEKLLERIIKASSNKGDVVLDPFCGCGSSVAVSQKLGRRWIGVDITYLAIDVISKRLEANNYIKGKDFVVEGEPRDFYSAEKLARQAPFQFEFWCVAKMDATPSPRQTGDEGVDGVLNFVDYSKKDKAGKGIIQVKGGQSINPSMVRDLKGTLKSQNADFGILIMLKKPTRGMIAEATKEGSFDFQLMKESKVQKIPRIQFLTAEDLFKDPLPIKTPSSIISPYKKPPITEEADQTPLF